MVQYCTRCKVIHNNNEICPHYVKQIKENPSLLAEAANFTVVAGQYHLVTSQTLDTLAQSVNKLAGTNLAYEGTHQFTRDIQVFRQLNVDSFSRSGHFANAKSAQSYFLNGTENQQQNVLRKLNGTAQEIDWLRWKKGKLSSLVEKSKLLGEETSNAPGIDGTSVNRFVKKRIEKVTIKASVSDKGLGTNIKGVLKALEKGTLDPKDTLVGIEGSSEALAKALDHNIKKALDAGNTEYAKRLQKAKEYMKVKELNNYDRVSRSTARLENKIKSGQAAVQVTANDVAKKACQGAIVGAAVSLTISSISNYMKYKNGEITEEEAFVSIGKETIKGGVVGGAMGALTLFLPGGALGFAAGMAIGIYLNATATNVLDEIFGEGAYGQILDASGYVCGMTVNLESALGKIEQNEKHLAGNIRKTKKTAESVDKNFDDFDLIMKE